MKTLVGIDEAGRGAAIGPMVVAAVSMDYDAFRHFEDMGLKDSKRYSAGRREELAAEIRQRCFAKWEFATPKQIDAALASKGDSLNKLEQRMASGLLRKMGEFDEVTLDGRSVFQGFDPGVKGSFQLRVYDKADEEFIEVAAASIVAKVERDLWLTNIWNATGWDYMCGGGYCNEHTFEFLKWYAKNCGKPDFVRWSWKWSGIPRLKRILKHA